jgi:hypothetical protein
MMALVGAMLLLWSLILPVLGILYVIEKIA